LDGNDSQFDNAVAGPSNVQRPSTSIPQIVHSSNDGHAKTAGNSVNPKEEFIELSDEDENDLEDIDGLDESMGGADFGNDDGGGGVNNSMADGLASQDPSLQMSSKDATFLVRGRDDLLRYGCRSCPENFRTGRDASEHFRIIHLPTFYKGEYLCLICSKLTHTASSARGHMAKFHPDTKQAAYINCPACMFGSTRTLDFVNHVLEVHLTDYYYN